MAKALDPHLGFARQTLAIAFGLDEGRPQLGDARAQRARAHAVGLGVGDRRQARLAEGAAHLGVGHVGHDLGDGLLDAAQPRAQLVGAAGDVGVMLARLRGVGFGGGDGALHGTLGRTRGLARALGLGARGFGHGALVRAGLFDAGLLRVARGGERNGLGVGTRLVQGMLGGDGIDLQADLGQRGCAG